MILSRERIAESGRPLFLLTKKAQKKKLGKKKSADGGVRLLRKARRAARPPRRHLLKKVDENFSSFKCGSKGGKNLPPFIEVFEGFGELFSKSSPKNYNKMQIRPVLPSLMMREMVSASFRRASSGMAASFWWMPSFTSS